MSIADIEESLEREWRARYGHLNYLPQRKPDGTYTPGIGHTGPPWPRGTGHDYCWEPNHCISCGCGPRGPQNCTHANLARILGWVPEDERPHAIPLTDPPHGD